MFYRLTDLHGGANLFEDRKVPIIKGKKYRLRLLALGDVGGTLLTGLLLLGADVIESIGICDISENTSKRFEMEMNQIAYPFDAYAFPNVEIVEEGQLFDGDVFLFCASKAVPEVGSAMQDVRMAQFSENRKIVEHYARIAASKKYKGMFAVVSDPVDPLCKAAYLASGLLPEQFRGFGLGVMNSRALYYAKKEPRFNIFLKEGRVFGPHGQDLVCADSTERYDDRRSRELTRLVVESNMKTRALGYKPYIAPALSSGAISVLLMLRGEWHYSSNYIGSGGEGAFLGAKNRIIDGCMQIEELLLPGALFERIKEAYDNLRKII